MHPGEDAASVELMWCVATGIRLGYCLYDVAFIQKIANPELSAPDLRSIFLHFQCFTVLTFVFTACLKKRTQHCVYYVSLGKRINDE